MTVRASGSLARFALESGRLTASVVKPKLFEPNRARELSVFHVDGLDGVGITLIGNDVVARHSTAKRLHGWGEFNEVAVCEAGLRIDRDDNPPRHANIVDWPKDAEKRKQCQQILASRACPHVPVRV